MDYLGLLINFKMNGLSGFTNKLKGEWIIWVAWTRGCSDYDAKT